MSEEIEQKEINLDTSDGWEAFLEYATEAYEELLEICDSYSHKQELKELIKSGRKAYESLENLCKEAQEKIKNGQSISYEDSEKAQLFYDTITEARDKSADFIDLIEVEVHQEEETKVNVADEVSLSIYESQKEIKSSVPEITDVASEPEPLSVDKVPSQKDESDSLAILNEAYKKIVNLEVSAQELISNYEEGVLSNDNYSEQLVFAQLKETHKRASEIKNKLESGTIEVTPNSAENIRRIVTEIGKNILQLKRGLELHLSDSLGTDIHSESGEDHVSEVVEVELSEMSGAVPVFKKQAKVPEIKKLEAPKSRHSFSSLKEGGAKKNLVPESLISDPYYKTFLKQHSVNWNQVEAAMHKNINETEKKSRFDSWFNVNQGSMFKIVLAPMTMRELSLFEQRSHEDISTYLKNVSKKEDAQFTYTTYRKWLHKFDEMIEIVPLSPDMTFAEVCALYELIHLMPVEM